MASSASPMSLDQVLDSLGLSEMKSPLQKAKWTFDALRNLADDDWKQDVKPLFLSYPGGYHTLKNWFQRLQAPRPSSSSSSSSSLSLSVSVSISMCLLYENH